MNDAPELTCDQVDRFKRERHFALSRGRFLHVEIKGRRRQWAYVLDLLALSPRSRRRLRVGWPGPAAVLGGVALLWAAWALWEGGALGGGYASLIGLAGAGLGAVGAALLADTFERCHVFCARGTGLPLVELWTGNPDRRSCGAFVREIERRIAAATERSGLSPQALRAGELRTLRRLAQEGVVSTRQYERAKSELLGAGPG